MRKGGLHMKNKDNMEGHEHRPQDSFVPIDRRSFIKQTAAGAAVFATASIGPWFIRNAFVLIRHLKSFYLARLLKTRGDKRF